MQEGHQKHALTGRYDRDEFVILFRNFIDQQLMEKAGELFSTLMAMRVWGNGYEIQFTVSMGMTESTGIAARKFTKLFRVLHMAKIHGKKPTVPIPAVASIVEGLSSKRGLPGRPPILLSFPPAMKPPGRLCSGLIG